MEVETGFPPVGQPIGELWRALQTMIRCEPAGEFWLGLPDGGVIQVLLVGPLPDLGNLGIVNLYFVVHLVRRQGWAAYPSEEGCNNREPADAGATSISPFTLANILMVQFAPNQYGLAGLKVMRLLTATDSGLRS